MSALRRADSPRLWPRFSQVEIERRLHAAGARFTVLSEAELIERTAASLARGQAVGWMQGRMEYGPRSLGARSILADPRSPRMQRQLNLKIKYRESFRPFAPAVLRGKAAEWFEFEGDSPYMLFVVGLLSERRRAMAAEERALFGVDKLNVVRSEIPAVTHVDYSARLQTVDAETNPRFHAMLKRFDDVTGCPILVISFNVRSEPIVCTPEDAFRCFMGRTELDLLAVGNCARDKKEQDAGLVHDYHDEFDPN
jgi:carbamoyltransferase